MIFKSRKFHVWLISAAVVLIIFLLYNQISKTPPIEIDIEAKFTDTVTKERKTDEFESKIGMVGDVGIGTVQKAKYSHLNAEQKVDREFGFEKLLHAEGNEWEIEKPYMNIYRNNLKCYMTADEGKVHVEDAVGRAAPKDATLKGNVVVHIVPEKSSSFKEGFLYLDDIIFDSEKSQFSTAGPVRFTSQSAQMLGRGMELVYNEALDRLEFLKIIDLEFLRIKQSSKASLFSSQESGPAVQTQTSQRKTKKVPAAGNEPIGEEKNEYYKCMFRKNVIINSSEQLILADEVSIDDILWSKGPDEKLESSDTDDTDKMKPYVEVAEENSPAPQVESNELPEKLVDIVITCDKGIAVVPMDSSETPENTTTDNKRPSSFYDEKGRPTFVAQKIHYHLTTKNIVANGPSELTFFANDIMDTESKPCVLPVKITAKQKTEFLPASNQVVFEGNVICSTLRNNLNFQQKYRLSTPKLTLDLSEDKQSRADIKHLTASGKVVQLDTSKWSEEELLGFTKLKCLNFEYDADRQTFFATGSGIIAADNSKIEEPKKKLGKFSLQRPCTAVVRYFDTLKYFSETNIIIADGGDEQLLLDYFPIVDGQYGRQASASASHIEAVLYETNSGRTEISTLSATDGITYREEGKKRWGGWGKSRDIQFMGSGMFYDSSSSMITAWGDESQPCFLNGALAPGIKYNLKNERIKTKVVSPGVLPIGR